MTEQKTGFDFEAMRRAIEGLDAEALVGLYADDAELLIVNKSTTPSSPRELRGKEEISEYLRDVCGRAMTHHIHSEMIGEDRVAFQEDCEYPDGMKVLAATTLDLRDGKVVRQVNVEAWDEQGRGARCRGGSRTPPLLATTGREAREERRFGRRA